MPLLATACADASLPAAWCRLAAWLTASTVSRKIGESAVLASRSRLSREFSLLGDSLSLLLDFLLFLVDLAPEPFILALELFDVPSLPFEESGGMARGSTTGKEVPKCLSCGLT